MYDQNPKSPAPNPKQEQNNENTKRYDLESRTFLFAKNVREYIRRLPARVTLIEDGKQLVRSSGSIGANYIEANESLSKKDLVLRLKISRKEAKESKYWLGLLSYEDEPVEFQRKREMLLKEATELSYILSAIIKKCSV